MPLSTSLNSTSVLPSASSRNRLSPSGNFQAATRSTSGNSVPQLASNSTLAPPGAASLLNVAVQLLSRSALENSHAPSSALAESPSDWPGAIAPDALGPWPARDNAAKRRTSQSRMTAHGYVTVSAGKAFPAPASAAACPTPRRECCRPRSWSIAARVTSVDEPRCGNSTTWSMSSSSCGTSRLLGEHVETGRIDRAVLQRLDQRRLVDHRAARHVDDDAARARAP